jgi:hypothetical protein
MIERIFSRVNTGERVSQRNQHESHLLRILQLSQELQSLH